jgi:arylsulfatase A-like enzyme
MPRYRFPLFIILSFILAAGCNVQVATGPFRIEPDRELQHGKTRFLQAVQELRPEDSLPNIVLILVDDLGKCDMSTYDSEGVPTPAIDRLASSGVRFTRAYATSPVCSPSRASLMTGRYQQRFGYERQPMNRYARGRLEYWVVDHFINTEPMQLISPMSNPEKEEIKKQGVPESEILLSELLERRGYRTGIFGKWHLGHHEAFLPNNRGFQEQFGFYEAFTYYAPKSTPGIVDYRHDYFANKHIWRQKRKGTCAIRENDSEIHDPEYLTFSIARRANLFMEQQGESPFFLFVPFSAPHTPFQVPVAYYDRFSHVEDPNKRLYYGMITALDDAVGMIIKKLEALGLEEHTLVIFASDNGGATYTDATDNGILKAGKFSQFEGGVNVPMIFSWKGRIPSGIDFDMPASLLDIYTTCASAARIDLPGDRIYDGMDLMPVLTGDLPVGQDRPLFWRTDFNKAVRYGSWKLVWNTRDEQLFLYNLDEDPGEKSNLADKEPGRVMELQDLLVEWESQMKDPMWPGVMEFRFIIDGEETLWAI